MSVKLRTGFRSVGVEGAGPSHSLRWLSAMELIVVQQTYSYWYLYSHLKAFVFINY
jgi:hypothetical protein